MRALLFSIALVLGLALAAEAVACEADSDCEPGTHCQIEPGRKVGVCVNDVAPTPPQRDTIETPPVGDGAGAGKSCKTHEDCGVGGRCVKPDRAATGVCRKEM